MKNHLPLCLADLPGGHVEAIRRRKPLVIWPLGSIEYHGPHGALGTDLFIAEELARRVGLGLKALVLPPVAYTFTPPWTRNYPGSIFISEDTMVRLFRDVLTSLFRASLRRILVVNAHADNLRPLGAAVESLAEKFPDCFVLLANFWDALPEAALARMDLFSRDENVARSGGHGHGGPKEISAAMAARPGTVDMKMAKDSEKTPRTGGGMVHALLQGRPLPGWKGYHGRASEASAEKGEKILSLAAENMTRATRAWLRELKGVRSSDKKTVQP